MRQYLRDDCESIDATVFSGDVLYVDQERAELKAYIERWLRAIAEYEAGEQAELSPAVQR